VIAAVIDPYSQPDPSAGMAFGLKGDTGITILEEATA